MVLGVGQVIDCRVLSLSLATYRPAYSSRTTPPAVDLQYPQSISYSPTLPLTNRGT